MSRLAAREGHYDKPCSQNLLLMARYSNYRHFQPSVADIYDHWVEKPFARRMQGVQPSITTLNASVASPSLLEESGVGFISVVELFETILRLRVANEHFDPNLDFSPRGIWALIRSSERVVSALSASLLFDGCYEQRNLSQRTPDSP